jgi:type II secretory pathway predicted ATPase ExeA
MDLAHWGLRESPFRITMTPQHMTLLPGQSAAFDQIDRAYRDGERIALLVGPHGVGKTVLAQHLVASCESRGITSAWAACVPVVGSQALYQMLLADLGQPFSLRSTVELRMQLVDHLLPIISECKSILIIVDEAQHVPMAILEELRPLIEIVTPAGLPGVQLLLAGTEQLANQLNRSAGFGLSTWVGCRSELNRLDTEAALAFLHKQWRSAGGDPDRHATAEAWNMLAEIGNGMPLEMNRLARHAFRLAQELEQQTLDAEAVWEAAHELGLNHDDAEVEDELTVPLPVRSPLKDSA